MDVVRRAIGCNIENQIYAPIPEYSFAMYSSILHVLKMTGTKNVANQSDLF